MQRRDSTLDTNSGPSPFLAAPISPVTSVSYRSNYRSSVSTRGSSQTSYSTPQTPQTPASSQAAFAGYSVELSLENTIVYIAGLPQTKFKITLEAVQRKLSLALKATRKNQKDFYFYVCDFLGAFSRAVELFGPVPKPQYIKDLSQVSWILALLEPFLLFPLDSRLKKPLRQAQVTAFSEVCAMLKSVVVKYSKMPCIYKDLVEELWDYLIEILAESTQPMVIDYSFSVIKSILSKVPLCDDLVCKVVLLRSITLNYSRSYMTEFRMLHAYMFQTLVSEIKKTGKDPATQGYLYDIIGEVSRCVATESDPAVTNLFKQSLKALRSPDEGRVTRHSVKHVQSVPEFRKRTTNDRQHRHQHNPPQTPQSQHFFASSPTESTTTYRPAAPQPQPQPQPHRGQYGGTMSINSASTKSMQGMTIRTAVSHTNLRGTDAISQPPTPLDPYHPAAGPDRANEGYKEFRMSLRKAVVHKLKSWRGSLKS